MCQAFLNFDVGEGGLCTACVQLSIPKLCIAMEIFPLQLGKLTACRPATLCRLPEGVHSQSPAALSPGLPVSWA
jgi:hypothetical protein